LLNKRQILVADRAGVLEADTLLQTLSWAKRFVVINFPAYTRAFGVGACSPSVKNWFLVSMLNKVATFERLRMDHALWRRARRWIWPLIYRLEPILSFFYKKLMPLLLLELLARLLLVKQPSLFHVLGLHISLV